MIKLKKLLENVLSERFVNLTDKEDMEQYGDVVFDLLQNTYSSIGGYKGARNSEELVNKAGFMKLVRKNGKIVAAAIYKDQHGRKAIAKGHDGTTLGKTWVKDIYKNDLKFDRAWGEFSGGSEKYLLHKGAQPVPVEMVPKLIKRDIVPDSDGFHYTRNIGGTDIRKIVLVAPGADLTKLKENFKHLANDHRDIWEITGR